MWGTTLKSPKKVIPRDFLDSMLYWSATWDNVFPDVPYFPKKHDNFHLPPFVDRYHFCGKGSTEGSESSGVRKKRITDLIKSMRTTTQKYTTTFARANASLKEQMSEPSTAITTQMTGKKEGATRWIHPRDAMTVLQLSPLTRIQSSMKGRHIL